MKANTPSRTRCVLCLIAWFFLVHIVAGICAPRLNRIKYPQPIDLLALALIPVSAFHAARYAARTGIVFTIYGCLVSSVFWLYYLFDDQAVRVEDSVLRNMIITASLLTVVLAAACRFTASLRCRWDRRLRFPPGHCQRCAYNLTGNTSGVCPECGTEIDLPEK